MTKTAAIYARVSTPDQTKNTSLSSQLEDCRRYAAQHGFEVIEEVHDAYTGTELDRPNFNQIKALAGKIDAVIVWKQDRLGRADALDTVNLVYDLHTKGTEVHCSDTGLIQVSDFAGLVVTLARAQGARDERNNIVERSQRGRVARAKGGKVMMSRNVTYGYNYDPESGQLVINEEEARIVRLVYNFYLYGDETGKRLGGNAIATKLSQMGIPTKSDINGYSKKKKGYAVWGLTSVMRILRLETYCGRWYYNRRQKGNTATTRVWKDEGDWIAVEVPAIVSREMWEAVQEQREKNANNSRRNSKGNYLLGGRIVCSTCGYACRCRSDYRKREGGLGYYCCLGQEARNAVDGKTKTCFGSLRQDELDTAVWEAIANMLKHPELVLEGMRQKRRELEDQLEPDNVYLERCITQIAKLDSKRERLLQLYLDGKYEKEWLDSEMALIDKQHCELEDKVADLRRRIEVVEVAQNQEEEMREFCKIAAEGIDKFTFSDKRTVVESLDIKGYLRRGETQEEHVIVLSGFIPTVEVNISPNSVTFGFIPF